MPGHGVKIDIGEVQPLRTAVGNPFSRQVAVQIHLPQADGVGGRIAGRHRGNRLYVAHIGYRGQGAHRGGDSAGKIRRVHGMGDVQRAEVAGDILADMGVTEVLIIGGWRTDLQNFRTQIAHGDPSGHRIGAIDGIFKHDVRIAGLKLDLRQALEKVAGADPALADPFVGHQLRIEIADGAVGEGVTVQPLDVIRREQGHLRVFFCQLEGDIGDHHSQRQGFDADFLIGILTPGIEEAQNIGMVRMQPDRSRPLAGAKLVGIGEGVLQHLHHRHHPGGLIFDALDRRPGLAQVGE